MTISKKFAAVALALALGVPTVAFAATAMMDCCKDCKCCDHDKPAADSAAPTPAPKS